MKFGEKLFQTKLLSRLSNKVCRLLSSPVLLRKCTKLADLATERERHLTTGKRPERTKLDFRYPIAALHWSIQLFDLRAQSSTDVPVLLLTQPNQSTATTKGTSKTLQILWALCSTLFSPFLCRPWTTTTWNYKCPNFELTWERKRQGDKLYYLSLNSDAVPSLQSQPNFPTFK